MTETAVDPSRAQFDAFKALPRDTPIQMLNLIRFKDMADYPVDHPDHGKPISGREAYRAYGRDLADMLGRLGGRQVWTGRPEGVVTGPAHERWDLAFIVDYPNAGAFMAMVTDPAYREIVKHRTAAVADSRLIRLAPMNTSAALGN